VVDQVAGQGLPKSAPTENQDHGASDTSQLTETVDLQALHPSIARDILVQQAKFNTANSNTTQDKYTGHDTKEEDYAQELEHSHGNSNMRGVGFVSHFRLATLATG
jgi:hypothetical protein